MNWYWIMLLVGVVGAFAAGYWIGWEMHKAQVEIDMEKTIWVRDPECSACGRSDVVQKLPNGEYRCTRHSTSAMNHPTSRLLWPVPDENGDNIA